MIYYAIRHKLTKQIMPQMLRGRGYSHWNPSKPDVIVYSITDIPRLFTNKNHALRAISGWYNCPNARHDYDGDIKIGPMDDRKKEDLEIIKVSLRIGK